MSEGSGSERDSEPDRVDDKKQELQVIRKFVSKSKATHPTHPTFYKMVIEALLETNDKKGTSLHAIRSYILYNYQSVDANKMKSRLKMALNKGIEEGIIKRAKTTATATGLLGRFKIDKKVLEASKPKQKNTKKADEKKKSRPKKELKAKTATKKEAKEKSSLKSTRKTPAKSKTKSPRPVKTKKVMPASPKIANPKKNLMEELGKDKKKAPKTKTTATKAAKPKATAKEKPAAKKKTTPKKKASPKKKKEKAKE